MRGPYRIALCVIVTVVASCAPHSQPSAPCCPSSPPCWFPAPIHRPYRAEPNEDEVALKALLEHFRRHPFRGPGDACVTLPGYRSATAAVRSALGDAGISVTADPDCQFVVGAPVWCADGVWRTGADTFVVQLRLLSFDDLSRFVAGYEYTLLRGQDRWTVEKERESPCNKPERPPTDEGVHP